MNNSELYKMLDTRLAAMEEHNRKIEEHNKNIDNALNSLEEHNKNIDNALNSLEEHSKKVDKALISLNERMTKVEESVNFTKLTLELDVLPQLKEIQACYVDTFKRYQSGNEDIGSMKEDIQVMKKVIRNHSIILQQMQS